MYTVTNLPAERENCPHCARSFREVWRLLDHVATAHVEEEIVSSLCRIAEARAESALRRRP